MSDSVRPHRRQPTRLRRPWDSPGKNPGVGCHFLLQCMKVKSESEVAQSCPTLSDPITAAHHAPPSMGFCRQEYWSGLPLPSPPFPYFIQIRLNTKFIENSEVTFNFIQLIRFSVGNFLTREQMKSTHTTVLKEFGQIMSNRWH